MLAVPLTLDATLSHAVWVSSWVTEPTHCCLAATPPSKTTPLPPLVTMATHFDCGRVFFLGGVGGCGGGTRGLAGHLPAFLSGLDGDQMRVILSSARLIVTLLSCLSLPLLSLNLYFRRLAECSAKSLNSRKEVEGLGHGDLPQVKIYMKKRQKK